MSKNDIIRKLSSRKFWACVCGFVTSIMAMMSFSDSDAALVTSLITSAGCLVAYILSEGYIDAQHASDGAVPGGTSGGACEGDESKFDWSYASDDDEDFPE